MRSHGPWQLVDSTLKYQNPWIRVDEHAVIHPDGQPGIFGIVTVQPGIAVVAIDEEQHVYLCSEFRFAMGHYSIEAVCGGVDSSETFLEAAQRELAEELGIEADQWTDWGEVNPMTTIVDSPQRIFCAQQLRFGAAQPEGSEQITMVKMPLQTAIEKVMNGEITHGPTCVLLLKMARHLNY